MSHLIDLAVIDHHLLQLLVKMGTIFGRKGGKTYASQLVFTLQDVWLHYLKMPNLKANESISLKGEYIY